MCKAASSGRRLAASGKVGIITLNFPPTHKSMPKGKETTKGMMSWVRACEVGELCDDNPGCKVNRDLIGSACWSQTRGLEGPGQQSLGEFGAEKSHFFLRNKPGEWVPKIWI